MAAAAATLLAIITSLHVTRCLRDRIDRLLRYVCSARDYVNSTLQDASNKEVAGIAIVVLVLVVSPIIIILMRNAVATIQVRARS